MKDFERGSEWRRWDLHVHTKGTVKNDQFTSSDFNSFCKVMFREALDKNIAAIGITDYFNMENYKKIENFVNNIDSCSDFEEQEKFDIKEIFILPNVELRILPSTDSGSLINIHCIFNPDVFFLSRLENIFFGELKESGGNKMNHSGIIALGKSRNNKLDNDEAYKKGIDEFHLDLSSLIDLFKESTELKKNTIIVVSNSSGDGASALQSHYEIFANEPGSLDAVRSNIYKLSNAIFSGTPQDREFFLGEKAGCNKQMVINECGSLKPCIHGSDAHCENELFNPDENRFCWIKADPTFEGLKQILCEPEYRVRIQANEPDQKRSYQIIKSIDIKSKICKQIIQFNPNLNTIIGGRSTGKSLLLKLIAYSVNPKEHKQNNARENFFVNDILENDNLKITWQDGEISKNNENSENKENREIEFLPQNYMQEIARSDKAKNELINDIVKLKNKDKMLIAYNKFCTQNKSLLQESIDTLFDLKSEANFLRKKLTELGNKDSVTKEIEKLKEQIIKIPEDSSISNDDIDNIKEKYRGQRRLLEDLKKDINGITLLENEDLFSQSFIYKFNDLSNNSRLFIQKIFDDIKGKASRVWSEELSKNLKKMNQSLDRGNAEMGKIIASDAYVRAINYIKNNKQYEELANQLEKENNRLDEINSIHQQIKPIQKQGKDLFYKIISKHMDFKNEIKKLIISFSLEHDNISINLEKVHLKEKCLGLLKDFINMQSHDRQKYVNDWGKEYEKNIQETIKTFLDNALSNAIELKSHKHIKDLTKGILTENWFSLSYKLTYQDDTFETMSDGKKAFVILKLLLEFSDKECPILIDQPEDSLDNRAIYNELATYISEKKKKRQIILVTHNANIVLNADAEEVIVANQHGENSKNKDNVKFQYISGSLENTKDKDPSIDIILESQGIREHACEILEGGTEAFKKREDKYSIN